MPAERTDAPGVARTIKIALVTLSLLALTAWALTYYVFPQQWINWCNAFGNQASVAGLFVSLVGFALTLWALLLTQRIERQARARIERAVSEAQAQARDAVTRIGKHLLTGEAARFRQLVRVIQRAVQGGQWGRATRGCERARRFCTLFRENPHLRVEERDWLGRAEDNLRVIANYIRTNRTQPGSPTGWLPARHTNLLEAMHVLAVAIRARLRREILEAYHAND